MEPMRIKVGVVGSSGGRLGRETKRKAYLLGEELARQGCILLTGACPGLSYEAVKGCKQQEGMTVGISPALNLYEHTTRYRSPWRHFDLLIYTGDGLMGREIESVRSCDIVIVVGGRSGTLGEFAIAYDEGKVIGVLTGTGGIADRMAEIIAIVNKRTGAKVVYEAEPAALVRACLAAFRARGPQRRIPIKA